MIIKKQNKSAEQSTALQQPSAVQPTQTVLSQATVPEPPVDVFDIDNIDFSQRQERRRGDRRRGYRRIDDRNLISRAQEEADTIKETAAKEGYRAGLEQAESDIIDLRNKLADFVSSKQEVFEYIAPDLLEICVDIAKKIIKKEVEQDPQLILDSIVDVMKTVSKDEPRITVKINPLQVDLVKTELPEYISSRGIDAKITVLGDDSIAEGGCILNTNNGIVDATLDTQLYIIKEALKGM
ncbi:MAG: FliH/SctL family protein [Candidatus Gastranaerophilaceae bacterium]